MYHPMLTFAIAQTRLDDLDRDLSHRARRSTARASYAAPEHAVSLAPDRFARFAGARRTRAAMLVSRSQAVE